MPPATTLVTFLFDCPSAARTVELLGSWDNFSTPYHLKPDPRRSHSTWTGCFSFADIVCDGDLINLTEKRNGSLLMGGTYWYYYRVNDDKEYHNPAQPSTTLCPLLPGQRLNIMEIPTEIRSRSNSGSSDGFTRNPQDRYLNPVPPVPPKSIPSPRLGDYCQEPYRLPAYRPDPPRSATYPPQSQSQLLGIERPARSANSSPRFAPAAILPELKNLKGKFASARSAAGSQGANLCRQPRELEIGAPTLISTTAEDVNLIPLHLLQLPPTSSPTSSPIELKRKQFNPLRSNPVHPKRDLSIQIPRTAPARPALLTPRPQSEVSPSSPGLKSLSGHTRANSTDTRRTRVYVYSNEPWLSSPTVPHMPKRREEDVSDLHKSATAFELPGDSPMEQLTPGYGSDRSAVQPGTPQEKKLPALPRYLVPAPLSVSKSALSSPVLPDIEDVEEQPDDELQALSLVSKPNKSHFSTWSSNSSSSISPSDDEDVHSPTFSSLTSDSSDVGSPESDHGLSESERGEDESDDASSPLLDQPLLRLPIPSFGPDMFKFDMEEGETCLRRSVQNRRTACFGASSFQGYSLPSDESESQVTITKAALTSEPTIAPDRSSAVSQLETLMSDFGYLGDSVR